MAGYTARQSTYTSGDTILAAHTNDEFNTVLAAFDATTGHKHDGTAGEGAYVPLIADSDANNKLVSDSVNNRFGLFVEVTGSAVEQIRFQDGAIVPVTDNDIDFGTSVLEFKDLYIDGVAYVDSISMPTTTVTDILDEDTMSSDSATALATQQSIKAYVDSQVAAVPIGDITSVVAGTGLSGGGTTGDVTLNIDTATTVDLSTSQTLTNKILTSPVINTGVSGTAILDEDNMASNSDTKLATQQSIKAYVDSQVATANELSELTDVNITTPADGALLFYDTGTSKWIDNVVSGDITIADTGIAAIGSGVIVNADVNASAAIAHSKMAALTASRVLESDGSGIVSASSVTSTELGYVSGVTSAIQTQLNAKQDTITGGATTITSSDLTASRALIANASGKVAVSSVTDTELGYLSGVTSSIQTQINSAASAGFAVAMAIAL